MKEREANEAVADNCTSAWWQQVNQPQKEARGIPGGGVVRAVIAVVLVAACAAIVFGWPR